jgi:hypothetical protein
MLARPPSCVTLTSRLVPLWLQLEPLLVRQVTRVRDPTLSTPRALRLIPPMVPSSVSGQILSEECGACRQRFRVESNKGAGKLGSTDSTGNEAQGIITIACGPQPAL